MPILFIALGAVGALGISALIGGSRRLDVALFETRDPQVAAGLMEFLIGEGVGADVMADAFGQKFTVVVSSEDLEKAKQLNQVFLDAPPEEQRMFPGEQQPVIGL